MTPIDTPALHDPARHRAAAPASEILIVDDDPGAVQALGRILDGCGHLRFATCGADALRLAHETPPDIVLLDAEMPGMNGFAVCHALKADPALARVPVIFVTSHQEPAFEVEALGVGAVDFISKPLLAEQVLARVHARLRGVMPGAQPPEAPVPGRAAVAARLLLVDSDAAALHFERVTLAPMVGEVEFARSAAEALAQMARQPPDLVVAALQMPGMDGFDLCRRLQADEALRHVPVLLIASHADWRAEAHAFGLGASDFIARPYTPSVLQARVRNLLRQLRQADEAQRSQRTTWQRLGETRIAELVAAAPDALVSIDAEGRVVLINAAACRLLGVTATQALGRPLPALQAAGGPRTAATWHLGDGAARITTLRLCEPGGG